MILSELLIDKTEHEGAICGEACDNHDIVSEELNCWDPDDSDVEWEFVILHHPSNRYYRYYVWDKGVDQDPELEEVIPHQERVTKYRPI